MWLSIVVISLKLIITNSGAEVAFGSENGPFKSSSEESNVASAGFIPFYINLIYYAAFSNDEESITFPASSYLANRRGPWNIETSLSIWTRTRTFAFT